MAVMFIKKRSEARLGTSQAGRLPMSSTAVPGEHCTQLDALDLEAFAVRVAELVAARLAAALPAAMSDTDAAKYIGISRRQLWKLAATGGPKPVRIGRRALWRREDLDQFLATIGGGR
jgi:excisionase family DNA binding protein